MAKDGKKARKAKKTAGPADTAGSSRAKGSAKGKKGRPTRLESLRSAAMRPAIVITAAGAAAIAGITGLWRARR